MDTIGQGPRVDNYWITGRIGQTLEGNRLSTMVMSGPEIVVLSWLTTVTIGPKKKDRIG
jgi:hypothetical protein